MHIGILHRSYQYFRADRSTAKSLDVCFGSSSQKVALKFATSAVADCAYFVGSHTVGRLLDEESTTPARFYRSVRARQSFERFAAAPSPLAAFVAGDEGRSY